LDYERDTEAGLAYVRREHAEFIPTVAKDGTESDSDDALETLTQEG